MANSKGYYWRRWLGVFGALTVIAALAATQLTIKTGDFSLKNWASLFLVQIIIWNVWGALTPLIFRVSSWLSRTKSRLVAIMVHIPLSLIVVLLFLALYTAIFLFFSGGGRELFNGIFVGLIVSAFHWYMILYWITVGVEYFLRVQDSFKTQELLNLQLKNQLSEAQLKALKMQLNPHFLFNSLNTISGLVRGQDQKKAVAMLARLSDFLREVLVDRENQQITVAGEIGFLKKYLEIEQLRFGSKLVVDIQVQDSTLDFLIPSLIMQPLVENAIKHGISKSKQAEKLRINVESRDGRLSISIYNDGPAIQSNDDGELLGKGVGVSNSIKRLEKIYIDDFEFSIDNVDSGVEVKLDLPIRS